MAVIDFRIRYERLQQRAARLRRLRLALRALWLALLVPLAGLVAHVALGLPLAPVVWGVGALLVVLATLGWALVLRGERPLGQLLDSHFRLDDLLVTAVEVDRRGARSALEARLLDDAAAVVARLGADGVLDGRAVRREAETLMALGLVLGGLWLLAGVLGGPPAVTPLPPVGLQGTVAGQGAGGGGAERASERAGLASPEMGALAGALADHGAARGMAAALADGDPDRAARAARALADQAGGLSDAGRADLSEAMHRAADSVAEDAPALSDALRTAGRGLEGAPERRAAGLEGLAAALDALERGAAGASASGPPEAHSRTGPPAERLGAPPTPLPLAMTPGGDATSAGRAATDGRPRGEAAPSFVRGGSAPGTSDAVGPDPLRYPWPLRGAVRRYFDPGRAVR